jgi:hypothetical protein
VIQTTQVSEKPSIGIIFMEPLGHEASVQRLSLALAQCGYIPAQGPPPVGYPLAQDEWLGCAVVSTHDPHGECVLVDKVDATFRVALWLSASFTEQLFVGWRCFRGLEPCMKFFLNGQPRWKMTSLLRSLLGCRQTFEPRHASRGSCQFLMGKLWTQRNYRFPGSAISAAKAHWPPRTCFIGVW